MRILFIANGHGEDSIAASIIREIGDRAEIHAYPIVGAGAAYQGLCEIVGPRTHIPSEGWRHSKGSVARDVKGGMLSSVRPALKFLKSVKSQYDGVVAVGDNVAPILCLWAGLKIDIYLDVFKSGYAHRYSGAEKWLLGKTVRKTFCRDEMLAAQLRAAGLQAESHGNIMLDTVPYGDYDIAARRQHDLMITLLPGTRDWAAESLNVQIGALADLPAALQPDLFLALGGGVEVEDLARRTGMTHRPSNTGERHDEGQLIGRGLTIHLARGVAGNLMQAADLVLSQAGTATQQALGLGAPVVTYNRADNRIKRIRDEQALMGEARILTDENPLALRQAVLKLLRDKLERERLGQIGKARLGGPGTLQAVISELGL